MRANCFAYMDVASGEHCRILAEGCYNNEYCEKECPFFKTKEKFDEDKRKAEARAKELGIIID